MSREIYALLFSLSTALTVQLQNNALAINKETIFVAIQNNLEEVSNFHKIMRIVSVVTLTLMGIIATIMFSWNILDYQRAQKRFHLKPRSAESIIQSFNTITEQENNEKKEKEFGASTSSNISEYSAGLEPKSTDFPTLIPSKSRSSAGQDDNLYNKAVIRKSVDIAVEADKAVNYPTEFLNSLNLPGMPPHVLQLKIDVPIIMLRNISQPKLSNCKQLAGSAVKSMTGSSQLEINIVNADANAHRSALIMSLAQKHQSRWDEIEMMRHGLINCDCIRTTLPESISATYLVAE